MYYLLLSRYDGEPAHRWLSLLFIRILSHHPQYAPPCKDQLILVHLGEVALGRPYVHHGRKRPVSVASLLACLPQPVEHPVAVHPEFPPFLVHGHSHGLLRPSVASYGRTAIRTAIIVSISVLPQLNPLASANSASHLVYTLTERLPFFVTRVSHP